MSVSTLSLLRDISLSIATVHDRVALHTLVAQRLQPLLGFETATILVSQAAAHYRYLVVTGEAASHVAEQLTTRLPIDDSLYSWLLQQPTGQRLSLAELQRLAPSDPVLSQLQLAGLIGSVGATLRLHGQPIGFLWLHYRIENAPLPSLSLLRAITDLVSVAVANIVVNEQAEQLQRQLLAPSQPDTPPRTRNYMAVCILDCFRQLLPFEASFLVTYDQNLTHEWFYLGDLPTNITRDEAVQAYHPQLRPRPDLEACKGRVGWLAQPAISLHSRAQLERVSDRQGYPVLRAALQEGLQESVIMRLQVGGEPVGSIFLYSFEVGHFAPYLPWFTHLQRLLEPVALSVSNVLAYEALHAANQEKALQLAVGHVLLNHQDRPQLFASLAREVDRAVPWDYFSIIRLADQHQAFRLRKDAAGQLLPAERAEELRDALSLDETTFDHAWQALKGVATQPGVYTGAAFENLSARYRLLQGLRQLYGIKSLLCLPLSSVDGELLITLGHRHPYGFTTAQLALLQRLGVQITLVLQNQAALQEILTLKQRLEAEKTYLVQEINTTHNAGEIVGSNSTLRQVFHDVDQVAYTDTTVLILGETGTGKELIARALHDRSPRREQVLVKVNCAALPPQLIESELFGHEKGAFTGALGQRIGKFELAHKGTLFLDEVGEIPLELQAKLLRALQEREIERLGGSTVRKVDVRIIAATNRVLSAEVAAGRFRADLFYRLSVFPITLPPLRARQEDIPLLAAYFGQKVGRRLNRPFRGIQESCLAQLVVYSWPGNVRELENIIEHAVIISNGQPLICQLPAVPSPSASISMPAVGLPLVGISARERELGEQERIEAVLLQTHWRIRGAGGAAAILQLKPTTLEARMKRLGIRK